MTTTSFLFGKAAARGCAMAVASILSVARLAAGQTPVLNEQQVFTTQAAHYGDFLGRTLAVSGSGNTMVVGAPHDASVAYWSPDFGAVYVFERNPATGAWAQQARLLSGEPWREPPDHFGAALALSDDGNTLVVGAPAWGQAYVFQRTGADWSMVDQLFMGDDRFGAAVAIRGSTILVGAPFAPGESFPWSGAVFVYRPGSEGWTHTATLETADGGLEDEFGASVAIDEDENTIVVGAPRDSEPNDACTSGARQQGCHRGAAFVFELDTSTGNWEQVAKLTASPEPGIGRGFDYFGHSVSISRGTVVVGAPADQTASLVLSGAAYVFNQTPSWQQSTVLTSSSPDHGHNFGHAVAVWGTNILVGAPYTGEACPPNQFGGCNSGSAYLFQLSGATWSEQAKLLPSDTAAHRHFGASLAMIGTNVAIGAPTTITSGNGRGYFFSLGSAPDLSETLVSEPPASVSVGDTFTVMDAVWNGGNAWTSRTTKTRYYLSSDHRRDARDGYLGSSRNIDPLAPGAISMGSPGAFGIVTVPVIKQGAYYLLACADATHLIVESDESDNCIASIGTVAVSGADLIMTALSNPPSTAVLGSTFSIADTVANAGDQAAGPSTVRYYFSSDWTLDSSDVLLGHRGLADLAAGASANATNSVVSIPSLPPGYYFLIACADALAAVVETDEVNNCRPSASATNVSGPNLRATAVGNPPASAVFGTTFTATDTVRNMSSVSAAATWVRFYLSLNVVKGASDRLLTGHRAVGALGAGGTSSGSASVQIPPMPAGTYFLLACADDLGVVVEVDEQDNCLASATRVTVGGPDLTETSVTNPPASAVIGAGISITDGVTNQGNVAAGAFTIRYYFSYNTTRGTDDILLGGSRSLTGLAAGASSMVGATVLLPSMPSGSYFVLACADDLAVVAEAVEDNNCVTSQTTIVVTGPDLIVSTVSGPPASVTRGTVFAVTDTVFNLGDAVAPASTVRYVLSLNGIVDATDLMIGNRIVPSPVAPWTGMSGSGIAAIPPTMPPGTYYMFACADGGNQVTERSETNNCKVAGNLITVR